jgi:hypothetical protein
MEAAMPTLLFASASIARRIAQAEPAPRTRYHTAACAKALDPPSDGARRPTAPNADPAT